MKKIISLLVAATMLFALVGCTPKTTTSDNSNPTTAPTAPASAVDKIKAAGKLVIGTNAEFEPFEYKEGTKIVGFDMDLAQKIADSLGVTLDIQDMNFDSIVVAIEAGQVDLGMAGMTITEDRQKNVDFSVPYFNASQKIIVKNDSTIATKEDLTGKKVGVQMGTTGDTVVTDTLKIKPERFNKGADAVQALLSGAIDAVVIDNYPAESFVALNSDKLKTVSGGFDNESYGIAIKKDRQALVDAVNKVINDMNANDEMNTLLSKYKLN